MTAAISMSNTAPSFFYDYHNISVILAGPYLLQRFAKIWHCFGKIYFYSFSNYKLHVCFPHCVHLTWLSSPLQLSSYSSPQIVNMPAVCILSNLKHCHQQILLQALQK